MKGAILLSSFALRIVQLLLLLSTPNPCRSQFGLLNGGSGSGGVPRPDDVDATSVEDMKTYAALSAKLQAAAPSISSQDALDLAAVLDALMQDPDTKEMVHNLNKAGGRQTSLQAFSDSLTQQEMVEGMKQTLDELKSLEYLFQTVGPERAIMEMLKDGVVSEKGIPYYQQNPQQLEEDTRKGLYFSLVSLASVAGFL